MHTRPNGGCGYNIPHATQSGYISCRYRSYVLLFERRFYHGTFISEILRSEGGNMANVFLNPASVPGTWSDSSPVPAQAPIHAATPAAAAESNAVVTRPKAVAW